jgi:hypothetical protein
VFLRTGRHPGAPVAIAQFEQATLRGNVFAGYSGEIVKGATLPQRQQIAAANVIVTTEPARPR